MRGRLGAGLVWAGVAALAVVPAATGAKAKPKPWPVKAKVKVGDDYFAPLKVKVPVHSRVRFTWLTGNANTHDVKLKKGPSGVKRFHSDPATSDFSYSPKLRKKGTYKIICTFHEDMVTTVLVR
jgi:plastocyanin